MILYIVENINLNDKCSNPDTNYIYNVLTNLIKDVEFVDIKK